MSECTAHHNILSVIYVFTGDSFTEGSIDLKCKERVTDSDEENDPADETDGKVKFTFSSVPSF